MSDDTFGNLRRKIIEPREKSALEKFLKFYFELRYPKMTTPEMEEGEGEGVARLQVPLISHQCVYPFILQCLLFSRIAL